MISLLLTLVLFAGDLAAAEQALAQGRPQQALDLLGDLGDRDDAPVRALVVLGRAHLRLRAYVAAVEPLLRASDALPDDKKLARDAAYACWGSAEGVYAMAYLEDAKRMARRAGDPMLLADVHYAARDYEAALEHYRAVADDERTRLHVKTRIGEALLQLGKEEEGRTALGVALEEAIRRADLSAAYRLGFAARKSGRLLAWLDERLEETPDDEWARLYRGYARAQALMYREAVDDLRLVLAKRPDDVATLERLAFALIRAGAEEGDAAAVTEGRDHALAVLDAQPENQSAFNWLAWLNHRYWLNGDTEGALALSRELMRRRPDDVNTCLNFCGFARRLGRYAEAEAVFKRLLEDEFDLAPILNDYAILLDGMGRRDEAAALWRQVLDEDPENLNALENLFTDAWERGDRKDLAEYGARGLEAARRRDGPTARWLWFSDRLRWAPAAFGGTGS